MLKITPCIDYKGSDSLYRGLFPQEQHLLFIAIKLWQGPLEHVIYPCRGLPFSLFVWHILRSRTCLARGLRVRGDLLDPGVRCYRARTH